MGIGGISQKPNCSSFQLFFNVIFVVAAWPVEVMNSHPVPGL